jgi:hypothetical protein
MLDAGWMLAIGNQVLRIEYRKSTDCKWFHAWMQRPQSKKKIIPLIWGRCDFG